MRLTLPVPPDRYKSPPQRARIATELWAALNLYCANCHSNRLRQAAANHPAIDYFCQNCEAPFQLKSQSRPFGRRILDAAYSTMIRAIREDRTPNLLALHYDREAWSVRNLFLIPRFAYSESAIECRKPLGPAAQQAGWVGCYIRLDLLPPDVRIPLVLDGASYEAREVRRMFARIRPLEKLRAKQRGWTLDVLTAIRSLGKGEFSLADAYSLEANLSKLHPENRHVRDKIRQQLQVLRDRGLLAFVSPGRYRLG
ncbi:MAG: DpnI domain-containing protein [Candidatus Acidiferrales bacterium]